MERGMWKSGVLYDSDEYRAWNRARMRRRRAEGVPWDENYERSDRGQDVRHTYEQGPRRVMRRAERNGWSTSGLLAWLPGGRDLNGFDLRNPAYWDKRLARAWDEARRDRAERWCELHRVAREERRRIGYVCEFCEPWLAMAPPYDPPKLLMIPRDHVLGTRVVT